MICELLKAYIDYGRIEEAARYDGQSGRMWMVYGLRGKNKRDPLMAFARCPGCGVEQIFDGENAGLRCLPDEPTEARMA